VQHHCLQGHLVDPVLENSPKRQRTDKTTNARFDRMVETMHSRSESSRYVPRKHKKRSGRSYSHMDDAYSLPKADHLKNGLSFVKLDAASSSSPAFSHPRHSDDSDQANI
jgi:hypothetical protein